MKWPFDPDLLIEIAGIFALFMLAYAIGSIWVAWMLLVFAVMEDLFG